MNAALVSARLTDSADRLRSSATDELEPLALAMRRRAAELELEARLVREIWMPGAATGPSASSLPVTNERSVHPVAA